MIYKALDLNGKGVISFVGGGGKTTAIFELSKELKSLGKKVLITTTTKIFIPKKEEYDYFFLKDIEEGFNPPKGSITVFAESYEGEKLKGISREKIDKLNEKSLFDIILIEADGSNMKPIKAPREDEPIIPQSTTKTIGIIGLDSLGNIVNNHTAHRPELLSAIVGEDVVIDEICIVKLVTHRAGLFKEARGENILLLNKANDEERIERGKKVRDILKTQGFDNTVIGDIKLKSFIR